MPRRLRPALLALLALLLALATGASAEEPTPAARFSQALDALPAPTEARAFHFEGELVVGGRAMGTVSMSAVPAELPGGGTGWRLVEKVSMFGGSMRRDAELLLDRRLQPVKGQLSEAAPGQTPRSGTWTRTEAGVDVTSKPEGAEPPEDAAPEPQRVALEGDVLTTTTALWLFCTLAQPAEGAYATRVFEPLPRAGDSHFEDAAWSLDGKGEWKGQPAYRMHGEKEGVKVDAGLAIDAPGLLGADFTRPDGMVMSFRPRTDATPEEKTDSFAAPATSAQDAALTAAMAFATGDVDLVDAIVHWPTVYGAAKKAYDAENAGNAEAEPFADAAAFRDGALQQLAQTLPKNPRPMIEGALKMVKPQLVTEAVGDGITRVKFPEMFRSMVLDVGEHDGKWYLVRFPR